MTYRPSEKHREDQPGRSECYSAHLKPTTHLSFFPPPHVRQVAGPDRLLRTDPADRLGGLRALTTMFEEVMRMH